jgi:hypothetical protein
VPPDVDMTKYNGNILHLHGLLRLIALYIKMPNYGKCFQNICLIVDFRVPKFVGNIPNYVSKFGILGEEPAKPEVLYLNS